MPNIEMMSHKQKLHACKEHQLKLEETIEIGDKVKIFYNQFVPKGIGCEAITSKIGPATIKFKLLENVNNTLGEIFKKIDYIRIPLVKDKNHWGINMRFESLKTRELKQTHSDKIHPVNPSKYVIRKYEDKSENNLGSKGMDELIKIRKAEKRFMKIIIEQAGIIQELANHINNNFK